MLVTSSVMSASVLASSRSSNVPVAGIAMPIRISSGTTVQMISTLVLS
jgi:hypothetical protein